MFWAPKKSRPGGIAQPRRAMGRPYLYMIFIVIVPRDDACPRLQTDSEHLHGLHLVIVVPQKPIEKHFKYLLSFKKRLTILLVKTGNPLASSPNIWLLQRSNRKTSSSVGPRQ